MSSLSKDEAEAANASFAALSSPTDCRWKSSMELGEGSEKRMCFNSYKSKFSLCIPEFGTEEAVGGKNPIRKPRLMLQQ